MKSLMKKIIAISILCLAAVTVGAQTMYDTIN